jgi:YrbI family 3-deoxy-D-manno-octulosonate 8-phosphate phosphatase
MSFTDICRRIELILSDVDGVMTDGGIHLLDSGEQLVKFHIRDGMGVRLWREAGKRFGIVTGRNLEAVRRRAAERAIARTILDRMAAQERARAYREAARPDRPLSHRWSAGV